MYTRQQYEHELEAVDAADSCISAAVAQVDYAGRLDAFVGDYVEIASYFWDRCPVTRKKLIKPGRDVEKMADMFITLVEGQWVSGLQSKHLSAAMERVRRKLKGKLFMTRMLAQDNEASGRCDDIQNHKQPCMCRPLNLYRLANKEER